MTDHTKALEEAKKMDPVLVEAICQQVENALELGMTWAEFTEVEVNGRQG